MKRFSHLLTAMACSAGATVLGLLPHTATASDSEDYPHRYEGDILPQEAFPLWAESRKNGGGNTMLNDGWLRVEVPADAVHFYNVGGDGAVEFDGSTPAGTTIDFRLRVEPGANPESEVFGIRVGTGEVSWQVVFTPDRVLIGSREFFHDVTEADTYRIAFRDGDMALYSARAGALFESVQGDDRYADNRISMGSRQSLRADEPVTWELDFIRWTNDEAKFAPPVQP